MSGVRRLSPKAGHAATRKRRPIVSPIVTGIPQKGWETAVLLAAFSQKPVRAAGTGGCVYPPNTRTHAVNHPIHTHNTCTNPHMHPQVALLQLLRHKYPLLAFPLTSAELAGETDDDTNTHATAADSPKHPPAPLEIPTMVQYTDTGEEVDLHVIFMLSALGCAQVLGPMACA